MLNYFKKSRRNESNDNLKMSKKKKIIRLNAGELLTENYYFHFLLLVAKWLKINLLEVIGLYN